MYYRLGSLEFGCVESNVRNYESLVSNTNLVIHAGDFLGIEYQGKIYLVFRHNLLHKI